MNFMLPWKSLALVFVARAEIWPKVDDVRPVVGVLKIGWFNTLKASSRRVMFSDSQIGKIREICASNWVAVGPRKEFLPIFP